MPVLTREVFDALIIAVVVIGLIAAAIRLRADLSRPQPPDPAYKRFDPDDDDQPDKPV